MLPDPAPSSRPNFKIIALLSLGHLCVDTNQGAISAILPYIKAAQGLSYTAAGALVLVANLTSSVIQPVFGLLADRSARSWMLPTAVLLAGTGLGLTGLAHSYLLVMGLLAVMGLGIASYHPEGYRAAASVAGSRKATAVSWFSFGGNIGIALGPPIITFLVVNFGLRGSMGMMVPAAVVATILSFTSPHIAHQKRTSAALNKDAKNRNGAMTLLVAVVTVRSWTQLGFATYIPFYYLDHLNASPEKVALLLFLFLGAGAAGTLVGGPLADLLGVRNVMIGAFLVSVPLGTLFLLSNGILSYVLLGLYGAALVSAFTTSVVLGQAYLPKNPGMASGLIVGFSIGTGGAAVTLFGRIADLYGVPVVLWICACLPLIGFAGAFFLPNPQKTPQRHKDTEI